MLSFFKASFQRLIAATQLESKRYLYPHFKVNHRLTGLVGPRGVGKSTMLLQYIKEHYHKDEALYFSADHVYFNTSSLIAFVENGVQEGYNIFFIDEIHRYANWNQELKNIYDAFPEVQVVFSGSSSIDLIQGSYDLSRRAKLYALSGLSFREHLSFAQGIQIEPFTLAELLDRPQKFDHLLPNIPKVKTYFYTYLKQGFYPFVFEDPEALEEKLLRVVQKNIYEDIASFYNLKTSNLFYFSKILAFLAETAPGELSINALANNLAIDHKTTQTYIQILEEVGLIRLLHIDRMGNVRLRKPQKAYLHNTTLLSALAHAAGSEPNKGTLRECFFLQALTGQKDPVFYTTAGDFKIRGLAYEIGGKNKSSAQLKGQQGWVVKDELLVAEKGVIPLMLFGFLY